MEMNAFCFRNEIILKYILGQLIDVEKLMCSILSKGNEVDRVSTYNRRTVFLKAIGDPSVRLTFADLVGLRGMCASYVTRLMLTSQIPSRLSANIKCFNPAPCPFTIIRD